VKALLYQQHGGTDVLEYVDVETPRPERRDVLIKVVATTVNHLDLVQRKGIYTLPGHSFPHIAGMDVVGVVEEVGDDVTAVRTGARVVVDPSMAMVPEGSRLAGKGDLYGELGIIGATESGGYADYCLAPETHVYEIPEAMSWHQAVVFPTAWMTAHHALFDVAGLKASDTIMIHAAGSGVSMAAVQWAKNAGATVLATAGSVEKCQRALDLGADHVCNNRETDVAGWARELTAGAGVELVFDHVGEALWDASMFALAPRGRLVTCGNTSGNFPKINLGYFFHMGLQVLGSDPYRYEEFAPAWRQYCDGSFQAVVDSVFPLREGREAQDKVERADFFGKILLEP
jgi:NADPH:quinone reductase-like Zn-dependent oxidoreductase